MTIRNETDFRMITRHLIEQCELNEIEETGKKLKEIIDDIVREEIKFCKPDLT